MRDKPTTPRKLIVLDLDETLIFGTRNMLDRPSDFVVSPYQIYKRPHLDQFLDYCFREFSVAVWTSSSPQYATQVTERIFEFAEKPLFVWARDRCTQRFEPEMQEFFWLKNLSKLKKKGYALESVLMIDDSPEKLHKHYGNHIRVRPYLGTTEDDELILLARYLESIKDCQNVRKLEKRGWRSESESDLQSRSEFS